MSDIQVPTPRPLVWIGNSKRNLRGFPEGAQKLIGNELQLLQFGGMPKDVKPFSGIGSGVVEIALRYDKDAYRTVVALQVGKRIYVLHAFQKKSKRGVAIPKTDITLIKARLKTAEVDYKSRQAG